MNPVSGEQHEPRGRRVPDGEWFTWRNAQTLQPGDYGREHITKDSGTPNERTEWDWFVCCPDGTTTALWVNEDDRNGNRHVITEHDDGTISVGGSILGHADPAWHGFLERGVWRSA